MKRNLKGSFFNFFEWHINKYLIVSFFFESAYSVVQLLDRIWKKKLNWPLVCRKYINLLKTGILLHQFLTFLLFLKKYFFLSFSIWNIKEDRLNIYWRVLQKKLRKESFQVSFHSFKKSSSLSLNIFTI